jgi:hypothetical protein
VEARTLDLTTLATRRAWVHAGGTLVALGIPTLIAVSVPLAAAYFVGEGRAAVAAAVVAGGAAAALAARFLGVALQRGSVAAAAAVGGLSVLAVAATSWLLRGEAIVAICSGALQAFFALIVLLGSWQSSRRGARTAAAHCPCSPPGCPLGVRPPGGHR